MRTIGIPQHIWLVIMCLFTAILGNAVDNSNYMPLSSPELRRVINHLMAQKITPDNDLLLETYLRQYRGKYNDPFNDANTLKSITNMNIPIIVLKRAPDEVYARIAKHY